MQFVVECTCHDQLNRDNFYNYRDNVSVTIIMYMFFIYYPSFARAKSNGSVICYNYDDLHVVRVKTDVH